MGLTVLATISSTMNTKMDQWAKTRRAWIKSSHDGIMQGCKTSMMYLIDGIILLMDQI